MSMNTNARGWMTSVSIAREDMDVDILSKVNENNFEHGSKFLTTDFFFGDPSPSLFSLDFSRLHSPVTSRFVVFFSVDIKS